jgi:hypothetical protein
MAEKFVQGNLWRRDGRVGCWWFRLDSGPRDPANIPFILRFEGQAGSAGGDSEELAVPTAATQSCSNERNLHLG